MAGQSQKHIPEDLFGASFEQIPDLSKVLESCSREEKTFTADKFEAIRGESLQEEKARKAAREQICETLKPFYNIFCHHKVRPVLIELAVIQDPRLEREKTLGIEFRPRDDPQYFASHISAYGERPDTDALLNAWNDSTNALAKIAGETEKNMIVPAEDTYRRTFLLQQFPQQSPSRRLGHPETPGGAGSSPCLVWKNRYDMPEQAMRKPTLATGTIDATVKLLTEKIVEFLDDPYVVRGVPPAPSSGPTPDWFLLVVPFRRPPSSRSRAGQGGATPEGRRQPTVDVSERGGCLLAILEPEAEALAEDFFPRLALTLGWYLSLAGLREAHIDIALRNEQRKSLAIVSHFLPTESGNARYEMRQAYECLTETPENLVASKEHLRQAIFHSERLDRSIEFSIDAWKAGTRMGSRRGFRTKHCDEFLRHLHETVRKCWADIQRIRPSCPEDAAQDGWGQLYFHVDPSWPAQASINYDEDYLSAVLTEALLNVQSHGQVPVRLRLLVQPDPKSDSPIASLEVSNAIRSDRIERAEQLTTDDGNLGLTSLKFAAEACGLPEPIFFPETVKKERRFDILISLGRLCGQQRPSGPEGM